MFGRGCHLISSSDHLVNQTEMQTFQSSYSQPSLASSNLTCSLGREPLLFSPHPAQQTVSESFNLFNDIPTYLFRLHARQTAGETTNVSYKRATTISKRPAFRATRHLPSQQPIFLTTKYATHFKRSPDNLSPRGSSK